MEIGDVVKKCRKILIKIKKWPIELMGPVINYISERMKNNGKLRAHVGAQGNIDCK